MNILCSDLESAFLPELWLEIAEGLGLESLKLTTRDIPDLNVLMQKRFDVLKENKINLKRIQEIVKKSELLDGAGDFLKWAKTKMPVVILSDTFWEFVSPLLEKMEYSTVLCNYLEIDKNGYISNFHIRQDSKKRTVRFFKDSGFNVIAIGDSYNDIGMLSEANHGFLFNASQKISQDFNQFPSILNYDDLKTNLEKIIK